MKLFSKIDQFFRKYDHKAFFLLLFLFIVLSVILFNKNISTGGDDAGYMVAARDFLRGKSFPSWHGSFYPVFLSLFIPLVGLNIPVFKILSLLLVTGHFIFFYLTFRKRTPAYAFWLSLAVTAFSAQLIFYASQTYSEALFLFLQALCFYLFYRYFEDDSSPVSFTVRLRRTILFSLVLFLLSSTRNIGAVAFIPFTGWLIIRKKYRDGGFILGFYILFHAGLHLYKKLVWHIQSSGISGQLHNVAWKNFYNHQLGKEDFWGYLSRFWENSNLYLSKHIPQMIGLKSVGSQSTNLWLTLLFYVLFVGSAVLIFRKWKKMTPVGLYLAILIGGTFISQQTHWDQERLIIIYLPMIILFLGTGIFLWITDYHKNWQLPAVILAGIIVLTTAGATVSRISPAQLKNNFHGDAYSSFTPDWQNYLRMCSWVGRHLPDSTVILCRKPDMAEIYGNANFKGQYRLWSSNPDSLKKRYQQKGITHIIMASLRIDPHRRTNRTINTVRKNLAYLTLKYPTALRIKKLIGTNEPAYLLELNFNHPVNSENMLASLNADIIVNPENFTFTRLKAEEYLQTQKYSKSAYFFSLSIRANPHPKAEDFFRRGLCYQKLNNYSLALKDYRIAQKMNLKDDKISTNINDCEEQLAKKAGNNKKKINQATIFAH